MTTRVEELPEVTVVVPTRNNESTIRACLNSIRCQIGVTVELIVVDNHSADATATIAAELASRVIVQGPERSAQRNAGARAGRAPYLLFIDSDMNLGPAVVRDCLRVVRHGARAVVIPERSIGSGFWTECKALERSFYLGVDWMEAARFFERTAFDALQGYDENLTGPEDFDLPQRLVERYGPAAVGRCSDFIDHDEQHLSLATTLRKKHYYAKNLDNYRSGSANTERFHRQASPVARYALYLRKPGKLLRRPAVGVGMLTMKTLEFAAGGTGYLTRNRS